jgi:exodeoxyribonuclease-5
MIFGLIKRALSGPLRSPPAPKSKVPATLLTAPAYAVAVRPVTPKKPKAISNLSVEAVVARTSETSAPRVQKLILTADQEEALTKIKTAYEPGGLYLLTGHAGSGKTTLIQRFTTDMLEDMRSVILSAPTHKAVAVLAMKLKEAHIDNVSCRTIHSVLSLKPKRQADRSIYERDRHANPVLADVVVIDECSMVSQELYRHVKRNLPNAFVLFVGDPAQLPPVGESESQTFSTKNHAHLTTIVRQAADNPILDAASIIRKSQGGSADVSWCKSSSLANGHGIFLPGHAAERWMRKAFTSTEFDSDPDSFRYLAWTNARVDTVNEKIRRWRYGNNIPTPFMPGESCLFREPVVINEAIIFASNQESKVIAIERGSRNYKMAKADGVAEWTASLHTWDIRLLDTDGFERTVQMPADNTEFQRAIARIKDEAAEARVRWDHYHEFQQSLAHLQSIYSLTVHRSQGSTFGTVFIDLPDLRRREHENLLEAQQLQYVAVTRPSKRLIVVGVRAAS